MMVQMLGSFAEFERSMVRERTRAGLVAARDRGVKVGRPAKLSADQQQEIIRIVRDGSTALVQPGSLGSIARALPACWRARTNDVAEKTFLLAQEFKRIGWSYVLALHEGFQERWIIKLPRCFPAERFPTCASGPQDRGATTLLDSHHSFT
jgi:hypothetical protein